MILLFYPIYYFNHKRNNAKLIRMNSTQVKFTKIFAHLMRALRLLYFIWTIKNVNSLFLKTFFCFFVSRFYKHDEEIRNADDKTNTITQTKMAYFCYIYFIVSNRSVVAFPVTHFRKPKNLNKYTACYY